MKSLAGRLRQLESEYGSRFPAKTWWEQARDSCRTVSEAAGVPMGAVGHLGFLLGIQILNDPPILRDQPRLQARIEGLLEAIKAGRQLRDIAQERGWTATVRETWQRARGGQAA